MKHTQSEEQDGNRQADDKNQETRGPTTREFENPKLHSYSRASTGVVKSSEIGNKHLDTEYEPAMRLSLSHKSLGTEPKAIVFDITASDARKLADKLEEMADSIEERKREVLHCPVCGDEGNKYDAGRRNCTNKQCRIDSYKAETEPYSESDGIASGMTPHPEGDQ